MVSSDSGNYSCSPSNAESDMVGVHVLEGTGGLPRANVMASRAPSLGPWGATTVLALGAILIRGEFFKKIIRAFNV